MSEGWHTHNAADFAPAYTESAEAPPVPVDAPLIPSAPPIRPASEARFYELDYYRRFFDVDTSEVINRARSCFLPHMNYMWDDLRDSNDLYGPVWVSTTLVFVMAMTGNLASWSSSQSDAWYYDFGKVSLGASTIYTYTIVVGHILLFVFLIPVCSQSGVPPLLIGDRFLCFFGVISSMFGLDLPTNVFPGES
eukprot:m.117958 g.117958  ORF g.117958 m.117958 type:complete len:193 (+) comp51987_c0_seq4:81-659(+)